MFIAVFYMILAMLSITGGASLAKTIFPAIGPEMTTVLRLSFAAVILSVVFRIWKWVPRRKQLKPIMFYGVTLGLMNMLFYLSIARIPLGIALALEFTGPLAVALYGTRNWRDLIWLAFAMAGIVLLLPVTEVSAQLDPVGIALALFAGVFWALYIFAGKYAGASGHDHGMHSGITVAWGMSVAALVAMPIGFAAGSGGAITGHIALLALGVALLSSAIPYSLEMVALKKLPAKTYGILTSIEPAIGVLSGFVFLSERISGLQLLAIGCIMIASVGSTYCVNRGLQHPAT